LPKSKELFTNISSLPPDLGKHSFALYLVHGPTIGVVGERLFYLTGLKEPITPETKLNFGHYTNAWKHASWWPFPEKETPGLEGGFWLCIIICMPLFLYLAEIGTRCFDEPSVRFSSWVWRKLKTLK
jgi:peptidoglycan/LPS O-acetylase OafA/YrhL